MYGSKLALCLERGGKYGREDETAALNGILPSFMRRAFYRVGGGRVRHFPPFAGPSRSFGLMGFSCVILPNRDGPPFGRGVLKRRKRRVMTEF